MDNKNKLFSKSKDKDISWLPNKPTSPKSVDNKWKILIVDDDEDIHVVTKLALGNSIFENKKITFLHAYSAKEAWKILCQNDDIAIVLLDVVMETTSAGLDLVKKIRNEIKNKEIRIVLRTGQPGKVPEMDVIENYDINDYKVKTELTKDRLFSIVAASLRTYDLITDISRKNVELTKKNSILAMAVTANHEINQPLLVIQGNLEILEVALENDKVLHKYSKYTNSISKGINRITKILSKYKNSKDFSFGKYSPKTDMVNFK